MVEKSSHFSMEELFAHNLHSEGKTRKDKKKNTLQKQRAVFVVYCEDENRKHCEERLHVTWQIAYMGFKASSRKIPREPFF